MSADRVVFSPRTAREFLLCDPKLQGILLWLATQWPPTDMVIVDIFRTADEEAAAGGVSGIHTVGPPYRAIDVRVTNLSGDPQMAADNIGAIVNAKYVYDPTRPDKLVAFTQKHGTGPHVHLQVHPNTDFKPGQQA
jgi:hypothetical protein